MTNWNNSTYQKINSAKFMDDNIVVNFDNGDSVNISKENITPYGVTEIDWKNLKYTAFEITVPASPRPFEIPWDRIRVLTDKAFGKYLAEKSEEQSKLIGIKIKRLRDKNSISSKELAERAGITAQTISRIEQGHTDVSFATLRKILASMGYSLKDLANEETELEMESSHRSFQKLIKRLSYAGVDTNLLTKKIIPNRLQVAINNQKKEVPTLLIDEATSYISTVYGWTSDEIWNSPNLIINSEPASMAFFKKPSNANENQVKAYSHYAFYLAKTVLKAFPSKNRNSYPESIEEFKSKYFKRFEGINLSSLLEFIWDLGICVLPLNDSGVFHGASWNIDGRHVVVLKQTTSSHARWIFDLLHEIYHVFAHLDESNTSVVEVEELNPFSNNEAIEELEANSFANQVIFGDRAEELAEQCVSIAKWDIKNLSKAVQQVSKKEKIREDFLSNYMAFRLSHQGENWWSSAIKMQVTEPDPFTITSNFLTNKIQMNKLSPMDFNLLKTAITN